MQQCAARCGWMRGELQSGGHPEKGRPSQGIRDEIAFMTGSVEEGLAPAVAVQVKAEGGTSRPQMPQNGS